jgi:glycosyltransferase involved in cell wall biosynthesis
MKGPITKGEVQMYWKSDRPLRICLLSYRSKPHSGGQGVYIRCLSRALTDMGHYVEVVSGPPDPLLDDDISLIRLPCLDLYDPADPFRIPTLKELSEPINLIEWLGVSTMGFPEPFTFGLRAYLFLRKRFHHYDIIHDNQSLSYGIWAMSRFLPTIATIHHPVTVDRDIDIRASTMSWEKMKYLRWYSFIGMQKRVSRSLSHIITVSESAKNDISRDYGIPRQNFRIVFNGINTDRFHPIPGFERDHHHILVTNSADTPLKGLKYLLRAVHEISKQREIKITVVGTPKADGIIEKLVKTLGIGPLVTFTGWITGSEFVRLYAQATLAVVPSVYEGFGFPAGEAMACCVPVISTTGGALPEVVGDAGILVPPADTAALVRSITDLLDHPDRARALGKAGHQRVLNHFTWEKAAEKTIEAYREAIHAHRRV